MSDGGSSCTSRSRNLCRYEDEPVVAWEVEEVEADPADNGDCIGCAAGILLLTATLLPTASRPTDAACVLPDHFSNFSSSVLIRSSSDSPRSLESLEVELTEDARGELDAKEDVCSGTAPLLLLLLGSVPVEDDPIVGVTEPAAPTAAGCRSTEDVDEDDEDDDEDDEPDIPALAAAPADELSSLEYRIFLDRDEAKEPPTPPPPPIDPLLPPRELTLPAPPPTAALADTDDDDGEANDSGLSWDTSSALSTSSGFLKQTSAYRSVFWPTTFTHVTLPCFLYSWNKPSLSEVSDEREASPVWFGAPPPLLCVEEEQEDDLLLGERDRERDADRW
uniref:Uncharacterized protein n=1 Tax=Anopheles merus TaxID=30066 RepID=A0A182VLI3_ANOME